jgi:hypothetical protein
MTVRFKSVSASQRCAQVLSSKACARGGMFQQPKSHINCHLSTCWPLGVSCYRCCMRMASFCIGWRLLSVDNCGPFLALRWQATSILALSCAPAISLLTPPQATQKFAPARVRVWQLAGNFSIGGTDCTPVNVSGATTLLGDPGATASVPADAAPSRLPTLPPNGSVAAAANRTQPLPLAAVPIAAPSPPASVYSFGFKYTVGLIQIPPDAPDRYFQVRNATLWQLPQADGPSALSTAGSTRRLLQEGTAAAAGNMLPTAMPSAVFTILLWPFNRCAAVAVLYWSLDGALLC